MAIKEPDRATISVGERYRFTRREYYAMVEAGVLHENSRVELIQGEIVARAAINPRHASAVKRLNALFSVALAGRAVVGVQDPFAIGDDSEPEPDLTLAKPRADFYAAAHPQAADLLLVVEVAETSLRYDRDVKMPLYAAASVVEAWILNLSETMLEVYRDPGLKGYRSLQRLSPGDQVSPLAFPDLSLAVAALLPPAN